VFAEHGVWAGWDNAWEQKKLEATQSGCLKMPQNPHRPVHYPGDRPGHFVSLRFLGKIFLLKY